MPLTVWAQALSPNLFVRTPQVVNYNINQREVSYSPVISIGAGVSRGANFMELATFINDDDIYGFYTFFGTTLTSQDLKSGLHLYTNWFGEVTFVTEQDQYPDFFIYTSGVCFFLNQHFEWGSIGIPLCLGLAYSNETISLNTRTILNLSLNLN